MKTVEELYEVIESSPEDSLFIFDVDLVLTMPCDPCFQILTTVRHHSFIKPIFNSLEGGELDLCYALALMQGDQLFVEEKVPEILRAIHMKGFKAMALTALHVATIQGVTTTEWRLKELERLGIDFTKTFPEIAPFTLDIFDSHYGGRPTYQDGVLFSHIVQDKGTVLKAFLDHVNYRPASLVFVDDVEENVKAVEAMARREDIPFHGVHYRGAYHFPTPHVEESIAITQWQTLAVKAKLIAAELSNSQSLPPISLYSS